MSRKPIIAGNWKMNLLQADAKALFEGISSFVKDFSAQQLPTVVVAPVFTSLSVVNAVKCDCGCGENKSTSLHKIATGKNLVHILANYL